MVAPWAQGAWLLLAESLPAAEKKAEPLLLRLDPVTRTKVVMALLGIVLAGLGLVALAWLGGRRLRQLAGKSFPATRTGEEQWYRKPLTPPDSNTRGES